MSTEQIDQERIDAAVSRISRVNARLHLLDRMETTPSFTSELRLLREALHCLTTDDGSPSSPKSEPRGAPLSAQTEGGTP